MKLQYFIPPALVCALLAALYYHAPTARIGQPENASAPSALAVTQHPTQPESTHPAQRQPENEYNAFRRSQNESQPSVSTPPAPPIVQAARSQIGKTLRYDPAYTRLAYPMGDVPLEKGMCTDVVIRALRQQNMDLQTLVYRDMQSNFADYPRRWGLKQPDPNIDHRRVPNLIVIFHTARLGNARQPIPRGRHRYMGAQWQPPAAHRHRVQPQKRRYPVDYSQYWRRRARRRYFV